MIIWTIKLISSVRRAIAGRKHPSQLAWAVGFGLLLGLVPHGNLLAVGILIVVLSLKINHAMAALTAVAASFGATLLDPYSHLLGNAALSEPRFAQYAAQAWQLPLVPWTDLNNTVVLGSFLIGSALVVPVFLLTYPVFRLFAPKDGPEPTETAVAFEEVDAATHKIVVVDQGHRQVAKPHPNRQPTPSAAPDLGTAPDSDTSLKLADATETDQSAPDAASHDQDEDTADATDVAVETRIDVIRMKDYREAASKIESASPEEASSADQQPMDEALNYLLRQLRDSQQRKVA